MRRAGGLRGGGRLRRRSCVGFVRRLACRSCRVGHCRATLVGACDRCRRRRVGFPAGTGAMRWTVVSPVDAGSLSDAFGTDPIVRPLRALVSTDRRTGRASRDCRGLVLRTGHELAGRLSPHDRSASQRLTDAGHAARCGGVVCATSMRQVGRAGCLLRSGLPRRRSAGRPSKRWAGDRMSSRGFLGTGRWLLPAVSFS